jgi:zinc transporter
VRRKAAELRRYLAPQREAITRLQAEQQDWLDDIHRAHLHEVADRVIRYVEDLDLVRERSSVLQDVGGIPGAGSGGAFWAVVVLLAVFAAAEIWLFRRLKWI